MKLTASSSAGACKNWYLRQTYILLEEIFVCLEEIINELFFEALFYALLAVLKESQVGH